MRWLYLLSCMLNFALLGCSSSAVDYDPSLDYRQYLRYTFAPRQQEIPITLDDSRIEQSLTNALSRHGLVLDTDHPQFIIFYGIQVETELNATGPSFGFGFGSGNLGIGLSTPQRYAADTREYVSIRFVDTQTKKIIWQATDKKSLPATDVTSKRIDAIDQSVQKLIEQYPPPAP